MRWNLLLFCILVGGPAVAAPALHGSVSIGGTSVFSTDEGFAALDLPSGLLGPQVSADFEVLPRLSLGFSLSASVAEDRVFTGSAGGMMNARLSSQLLDAGARFYFVDRGFLAPYMRLSGGAGFGQLLLSFNGWDSPGQCEGQNGDDCALSQRLSRAAVPFVRLGIGAELLVPRRPRGTQGSENTSGLRVELGSNLGGGPGPTPAFQFNDSIGSLSFGFLYLNVAFVGHF